MESRAKSSIRIRKCWAKWLIKNKLRPSFIEQKLLVKRRQPTSMLNFAALFGCVCVCWGEGGGTILERLAEALGQVVPGGLPNLLV